MTYSLSVSDYRECPNCKEECSAEKPGYSHEGSRHDPVHLVCLANRIKTYDTVADRNQRGDESEPDRTTLRCDLCFLKIAEICGISVANPLINRDYTHQLAQAVINKAEELHPGSTADFVISDSPSWTQTLVRSGRKALSFFALGAAVFCAYQYFGSPLQIAQAAVSVVGENSLALVEKTAGAEIALKVAEKAILYTPLFLSECFGTFLESELENGAHLIKNEAFGLLKKLVENGRCIRFAQHLVDKEIAGDFSVYGNSLLEISAELMKKYQISLDRGVEILEKGLLSEHESISEFAFKILDDLSWKKGSDYFLLLLENQKYCLDRGISDRITQSPFALRIVELGLNSVRSYYRDISMDILLKMIQGGIGGSDLAVGELKSYLENRSSIQLFEQRDGQGFFRMVKLARGLAKQGIDQAFDLALKLVEKGLGTEGDQIQKKAVKLLKTLLDIDLGSDLNQKASDLFQKWLASPAV